MTPEQLADLQKRAEEVNRDLSVKVGQAQKYLAYFEEQRLAHTKRLEDLDRREKELAHRFKQLGYEKLRFDKQVNDAKQLGKEG